MFLITPLILQITELTLYTNNLSEIKNFYGCILSLKIISESEKEIIFKTGETRLIFLEDKNLENPVYHFAFNIPANKINEALEWTKSRTELLPVGDSLIADFKNWNAKSIYFFDSVGNIVEFISRFDLDNAAEEKFNSSQILNISEMGIINPDVASFRKKLADDYKIYDFVKSENDNTFSAMGDDNGLFIVVIPNRNWYPTKIPSKIFPFKVKFRNNENKSFEISN